MPTLGELAALVGGKVSGDSGMPIEGIAPVSDATERQITFITDKHYMARLPASRAGAVLVSPDTDVGGRPAIVVSDPQGALLVLLKKFAPAEPEVPRGIHPTAVVHPTAKVSPAASVGPHAVIEADVEIGEGTRIGALCFVGWGTRIGKDCRIHPLVSVYERVTIGNSVAIFSGTVIGADGFGFIPGKGAPVKIPQIGRVVIEDDVEIGANTCVDRAMSGVTVIKSGVKIDNQVQIAHNDVIGENTLIAGQTGIGGTTVLGRNVLVGGKVGIVDHVSLGDGAMVAALSGIHNSVPAGTTMYGYPAREAKEGLKLHAEIARLPHLTRRVRSLEARIAELEKKAGG